MRELRRKEEILTIFADLSNVSGIVLKKKVFEK